MTARASLLGHGDDSVPGPRDGAPDEQEVPLGVHLDHGEAQLRVARGTHVAGHPLALDDARRVGARADRAGLPMARVAVRGGATAEAVAVDYALKASALRGAGDLDPLAGRENVHLDLGAGRGCLAAV